MMKAFIVLAIAFISVASAWYPRKADFFWREYEGEISADAVKVDPKNGIEGSVYIGQGYFNGGLLPGLLREGKVELTAVVDGRIQKIYNNIKIMATFSPRPDIDFQWIPVKSDNFDSLKNLTILNIVTGGVEHDSNVFIGLHSEPGYANIGKVVDVESSSKALVIPNFAGEISTYDSFDVLALLTVQCYKDYSINNSEESN